MSGGSLDYISHRVEDIAMRLSDRTNTPLQRAFSVHLLKVAKALHDVEWVLSGDSGTGDDDQAIKEVLGDDVNAKVLSVLKEDAIKLIKELKEYSEFPKQ